MIEHAVSRRDKGEDGFMWSNIGNFIGFLGTLYSFDKINSIIFG